jgi:hypothetical protein
MPLRLELSGVAAADGVGQHISPPVLKRCLGGIDRLFYGRTSLWVSISTLPNGLREAKRLAGLNETVKHRTDASGG